MSDFKQSPLGIRYAGDEPTNDPTDKAYCVECGHWSGLHSEVFGCSAVYEWHNSELTHRCNCKVPQAVVEYPDMWEGE